MGRKEIDEALGIESIDGFLSDLNVDPKEADGFHEVDERVKESVDKIDA